MALPTRAKRILRSIRQAIPTGVVLGRKSAGDGPAEFIPLSEATESFLGSISATQGSVLYRGALAWTALAPGVDGQVLTTGGAAANPAWEDAAGTFVDLTDTPASYTGEAGKLVAVNSGETALEFVTSPALFTPVTAVGTGASQNITLPVSDLTDEQVGVFVNGIRYETDEYSITGTTLTVTTNASGDSVEIIDLRRGTSSGGGGGGSLWWFTPPTISTLSTAITDGTFTTAPAAVDDTDAGLILTGQADASGEGYLRLKTAPAAPFDVIVRVQVLSRANGHFNLGGLALRESSSGRKVVFGSMANSRFAAVRGTGASTPADILVGGDGTSTITTDCNCWFKASVDASFNVTFHISQDGKAWAQVASVTAATVGWSTVDQTGVSLHVRVNSAQPMAATFEHYSEA